MTKKELVDEIITRNWYDIQDAGGNILEAMQWLWGFTKQELRRRFLSD
jgi:hypothetical protein